MRDYPERITLELTNICNLECTFCPRHIVDMELGMMTSELFYKIVDEAKLYLPVSMVFFFRGESLLHPKIFEFIKYAKDQGLYPLQLASNGFALDEEAAEKILESGLDFISFSIDTNNDVLYNKSRKNGCLETSRDNIIKFIKKCKDKKDQGLDVPEIQISTVDIDEYREGQEEFISFWRQYADKVRVYVEHSSDGNLGSFSKEIASTVQERKFCKKLFTDIVVYWDGTIGLCNHDWDNKTNIGNASKLSLKGIWNSSNYQKIRDMHENNSISEDLACKNCDHWKIYYLPEGFLGKIYNKLESK